MDTVSMILLPRFFHPIFVFFLNHIDCYSPVGREKFLNLDPWCVQVRITPGPW
jgi:hypothetical protein